MSKRMIDSELIEALGTDIKFDGTGNVIVGKSLEVGGTTKLNGGIKPIHTYKWSLTQEGMKWDYTLESLYETQEGSLGYTIFNGYLRIHVKEVSVSQDYAIIGEYNAFGGQMNELSGITFGGYPVTSITEGTDLELFSYNSTTNKATFTKYALANTQPKLYRHILTMVANTEEGDPETSIIEYISTNNLNVDNLEKLTTLLKPTANFIYPLGPVVNSDLGGITDYNILEYSNSVWKFAGSASNTTKINVASVSDVVTTL